MHTCNKAVPYKVKVVKHYMPDVLNKVPAFFP